MVFCVGVSIRGAGNTPAPFLCNVVTSRRRQRLLASLICSIHGCGLQERSVAGASVVSVYRSATGRKITLRVPHRGPSSFNSSRGRSCHAENKKKKENMKRIVFVRENVRWKEVALVSATHLQGRSAGPLDVLFIFYLPSPNTNAKHYYYLCNYIDSPNSCKNNNILPNKYINCFSLCQLLILHNIYKYCKKKKN